MAVTHSIHQILASTNTNHGINQPLACICLALILTLGAFVSQAAARTLQDVALHDKYEQWMARYGRVYEDTDEKEKRFKIFKENVAYIESFNGAVNKPYKLGINQFADLTNEEFIATQNRFMGA